MLSNLGLADDVALLTETTQEMEQLNEKTEDAQRKKQGIYYITNFDLK